MQTDCELKTYPDSVAALVAIVRAAEQGGDPRLAKAARRELREKHGVRLDRPTEREATQ